MKNGGKNKSVAFVILVSVYDINNVLYYLKEVVVYFASEH